MNTNQQPSILVVDDEAELEAARLRLLPGNLGECFKVRNPDDVTESDLIGANLVLVDYKLDEWKANSTTDGLCKYVPNGLALTAILQQRARSGAHAVAFALHSAHLPELTAPFPHQPRIHLLSRMCNIGW